ncbi:hypothetical protein BO85DRAFT_114962 [Aspergillus piperis CBS 112811]|uniref:Uncharacterized protein n=1 Tax=Aspergillus piperis CBS 112811 TaxID=1448313 RepID=A0A8G1VRA5_9EURO|nr:hypothetical protein BO85DRAFT_114962 [Aspergillus piperis CBS 112811]RAH61700.1 hypothetical protein BO85DRAFT_114962 [Aspergillus piperis CBS 112811]
MFSAVSGMEPESEPRYDFRQGLSNSMNHRSYDLELLYRLTSCQHNRSSTLVGGQAPLVIFCGYTVVCSGPKHQHPDMHKLALVLEKFSRAGYCRHYLPSYN